MKLSFVSRTWAPRPQEVEEGVVVKIEEAIQDVPGIIEINSTSREGMGTVRAKTEAGSDINEISDRG